MRVIIIIIIIINVLFITLTWNPPGMESNSQICCCHRRVALLKAYNFYQLRELSGTWNNLVRVYRADPRDEGVAKMLQLCSIFLLDLVWGGSFEELGIWDFGT